jgi:endonuclease I
MTQAQAVAIEWDSASVTDGRLTVALSTSRPKGWTGHFENVLAQLGHRGQGWGEITVGKRKVHVDDVTQGAEADLRHFLESAALQANAAVGATDEQDDDDVSGPDDEMTAKFRSFAAGG